MEWRDEGILLSVRPHGEGSAIAEVFTPGHGRHLGVIRGGSSRRMAPLLQPGAQLALVWRARIEAHLGDFTAEPLRSRAGVLASGLALEGLGTVASLLHLALPERDPHPALFAPTVALLDAMAEGRDWAADYPLWELRLLDEIGFGLDLGACAVTGQRTGLAYVSPRTGRAVSREAAGPWADRLLPLPAMLKGEAAPDAEGIAAALRLTGHFLARELAQPGREATLPAARARMMARLAAG